MQIHIMKLNPIPFKQIYNKTKTYEGRLFDEKRQQIEIGDIIEFHNTENENEFFKVKVLNLLKFKTFEEIAKNLPSESLGFKGCSIKQIVDAYHEFYSIEREKQYGALAIQIELLQN